MRQYTVGIIGNGRFGNLLYKIYKERGQDRFTPMLYSRRENPDNEQFFTREEVAGCDIVIPCVPISQFEEQIKNIHSILKPNSLLVDVCSVNVHPKEVMLKYTASDVDLLSTHPMWGPDSSKNGTTFEGLKFIHDDIRIANDEIRDVFLSFWAELGCEMAQMTPEEHDRQAAYTHAYAFLIGRVGIILGVRRNKISTKGFEGILYNQEAVENDTGQLFHDMMLYNPYAKEMRKNFHVALNEIEKTLQ